MRKLQLLALLTLLSFAMSCGDDSPLKECAVCTQTGSSTVLPEYCANKVTVEAYIKTTEASGYTCVRK